MKNKLLFNYLTICIFAGALVAPVFNIKNVDAQEPSGIYILQSNEQGLVIEVQVPRYSFIEEIVDSDTVYTIDIEGFGQSSISGSPQVPLRGILFGIPANAQVSVNMLSNDEVIVQAPGLIKSAPGMDLSRIDDPFIEWFYEPNPDSYDNSELFPESPVKLTSDAWVRDQRIAGIEIYPFQYIASQGILVWHPRMLIEINFGVATGGYQDMPISGEIFDNPFEELLRATLINYDIAKNWRRVPYFETRESVAVEGERLRISTDHDGIYQITYDDLLDVGMTGYDPRTFHMTSQGEDVAIYVAGEQDGSFDPGDYIIFYGEAFHGERLAERYADENSGWITYTQQLTTGVRVLWHPSFNAFMMEKYTRDNIYWLQGGVSSNPPRMTWNDGTPGAAPIAQYYRVSNRIEREVGRWDYHFTSEDTWFTEFVYNTQLRTYTTTLSALASIPFSATVSGEFVAFSYNDSLSPDHHTVVGFNTLQNPIDEGYWDGRSRYHFETSLPSSVLVEGVNYINFQIIDDAASPPWIMVDWFEIEYDRRFLAEGDRLHFSGDNPGEWRYEIGGFTSPDIWALDVTNPMVPVGIANIEVFSSPNGYTGRFQANHPAGQRYYFASQQAIESPKSLSFYNPPDLKSIENGADYIIISAQEFIEESQLLADYRASQGLRTMVVNFSDVVNEFNDGIYHPLAIKNFLEYTFVNWEPPAPAYVILVGDGHWNLKGNNPQLYGSLPTFMPPNLGWVDPWQGEVDSANLLVTIVGDDPLPDMLIGRIPVNNADELHALVDKIISFEQAAPMAWQHNNLFVVDNTPDPAGNFVALAEGIINEYMEPGFSPIRIYLDDYIDYGLCGTPPYPGGPQCPNVNNAITQTLNYTGTQFVNFIGHASVRNWTHEQILLYHPDDPNNPNDRYYNDFDTLWNSHQLPVIVSMTCLDGYWNHPTLQPSIAELFLRLQEGGAVATFSPTGLGVATGHDFLQRGFYDAIYRQGIWTLGLATMSAKLNLFASGFNYDLINTYTIFGDPALRINSPYDLDLAPEFASQSGLEGTVVTYTIELTNTGLITDVFEISIENNTWPTTLPYYTISLRTGENVSIPVVVNIPIGMPGGAMDIAHLTVVSQGDRLESATTTLETIANVYGVSIYPPWASQYSLPGETITYTLKITNTSNISDTFDISVGGNTWASMPDRFVVGPLSASDGASLEVFVSIPPDVSDWEADTVVITATSRADPTRLAISVLETIARTYKVNLSPPIRYGAGIPGSDVIYSLLLTNTGGYDDTFEISAISDNGWGVNPGYAMIGPLSPGVSQSMTFTISIPLGMPGGMVDVTSINAVSIHDPNQSDNAELFTTVNVFGLDLFAEDNTLSAPPGTVVTYTLDVINLANTSDSFEVMVGGHQWNSYVTPMFFQLNAGGRINIHVRVEIPAGIFPGEMDSIAITVTSQSDPSQYETIMLTTVATGMFLPIVVK